VSFIHSGLTALKELWLQGNSLTELQSLEGLKVGKAPKLDITCPPSHDKAMSS
jgi:hypothetical protein